MSRESLLNYVTALMNMTKITFLCAIYSTELGVIPPYSSFYCKFFACHKINDN